MFVQESMCLNHLLGLITSRMIIYIVFKVFNTPLRGIIISSVVYMHLFRHRKLPGKAPSNTENLRGIGDMRVGVDL